MKVVKSRKEHRCSFERCCFIRDIPIGSVIVTNLLKKKEGGYFVLYYHIDCYVQSVMQYLKKLQGELEAKIEERNRIKSKPKGKNGRPRKYTDPLKARNLSSLLTYHKKAGNISRVEEIGMKLKELEVR